MKSLTWIIAGKDYAIGSILHLCFGRGGGRGETAYLRTEWAMAAMASLTGQHLSVV